jgi:hypothetical protein
MKSLSIYCSLFLIVSVFVAYLGGCSDEILTDFSERTNATDAQPQVKPYAENPYYWQYKDSLVVLIGGSWQDNLFNHPVILQEHLDLLKSVGGNYVRNVMSHRDDGNVFAYERTEEGDFDLDHFNEEYWRRFENFLEMTHRRDIIVQIEIWATWDLYANSQSKGGWAFHPFNPANNVTYTTEESELPVEIGYKPQPDPTDHPFFRSVPSLDNNEFLLRFQKQFVDKILSYSLAYPHIIYCINNETGERVEWSDYWAAYLYDQAAVTGKMVEVADMRRHNNLDSQDHAHLYDNPQRYTFLDISQNNGAGGQEHYDNILYVREQIASDPRPINNTKIYGAAYHGEEETVARMVRILFAGGASARFHRPHPIDDPARHTAKSGVGLGLSPRAQQVIQSLRTVVKEFAIEQTDPRNDLLNDRKNNEAYLLAEPGRQYAVYFPDGGSVIIDLADAEGEMKYRWINLDEGRWISSGNIMAEDTIRFTTPGDGHWIGIIDKGD